MDFCRKMEDGKGNMESIINLFNEISRIDNLKLEIGNWKKELL